jgi:hypothetical protein
VGYGLFSLSVIHKEDDDDDDDDDDDLIKRYDN